LQKNPYAKPPCRPARTEHAAGPDLHLKGRRGWMKSHLHSDGGPSKEKYKTGSNTGKKGPDHLKGERSY